MSKKYDYKQKWKINRNLYKFDIFLSNYSDFFYANVNKTIDFFKIFS